MLRKLPGDYTRDIVSTVPNSLVFRPVVVNTPAIFTILSMLFRAVAGLVRTVWRHPVACLVVAVPVVLCLLCGCGDGEDAVGAGRGWLAGQGRQPRPRVHRSRMPGQAQQTRPDDPSLPPV